MVRVRERYIVDARGKKTAIVLPLKEYQQLLDDLHDLSVIAERREGRPSWYGPTVDAPTPDGLR